MLEALITHFNILYLTPDLLGLSGGSIEESLMVRFLLGLELLDSFLTSSLMDDDVSTAGLGWDLGIPINLISAYLPGPL